jgi:hypothetical protein
MAKLNQSVFPKAVNVLGERLDPERSLWRNVLIVALEDAVGRHWRNKSFGIAKGNYAEAAQAPRKMYIITFCIGFILGALIL